MSFIRKLLNFLIRLLGGEEKISTEQATTDKPIEVIKPSIGYIDDAEFEWHFGDLPADEQYQIKLLIKEKKALGITEYQFTTSKKRIRVVNGGQILESTKI